MRRSSQPTLKPSTTTTTTVSFTPNTLSIPTPYHHRDHNTLTPRSPTRVNPTDISDDIDDDLFGSAAWKKKRTGKRGGKKTGSSRENDGKTDDLSRSKRWAVVRFMEQHAKRVRGHACAVQKWFKSVCEGFRTLHYSERGQPLLSEGGGRNGLAVPTANGSPAGMTARPEKCELTSEGLAEETKLLCENYIFHRLTSKGLMTKRVPASVTAHPSLIADELYSAGQELERLYPKVYTDISRRISMTSAQLVRRALTSILEDIFSSGVTWARLVAMVAISAAFAEECVVQGHPNFVEDVVMCVGHFVTVRLSEWLIGHGGWDSFPTSRPPAVLEPESMQGTGPVLLWAVVAVVLMGAAIFLFLLLLSPLLGVT